MLQLMEDAVIIRCREVDAKLVEVNNTITIIITRTQTLSKALMLANVRLNLAQIKLYVY